MEGYKNAKEGNEALGIQPGSELIDINLVRGGTDIDGWVGSRYHGANTRRLEPATEQLVHLFLHAPDVLKQAVTEICQTTKHISTSYVYDYRSLQDI